MEKSQFVDVVTPGWWLLQPSLDPPLDETRRKVGACWGWTDADAWYTKPESLETVFQFLTDNQRRLLDELDQPQDAYQREKWCNDLIEARQPPEAEARQPAAPPPPAARTAGGAAPPLAPSPPRKASAFGQRTPGQAETEQPGQAPPAAAERPADAAAAQPRKPSPFAKKAAATAEPAAPSPPAGGAESPPPLPPTVAEMRETIAELAENPAVPISTQELQAAERDPDFGAKLAAAESELEAELQAELAAELEAELASAEAPE